MRISDLQIRAEANPEQADTFRCTEMAPASRAGVVQMGMGDDGPLHRFPGVNEKFYCLKTIADFNMISERAGCVYWITQAA